MRSGFYCSKCGAMYSHPGTGFITCSQCGSIGLRGFARPPRRVSCTVEGCDWTGWDDGGVNDDLGRHKREHPAVYR